jgi:hypothetical protein
LAARIDMTALAPGHEMDAEMRIRDMLRSADHRNSGADAAAFPDVGFSATRAKGVKEIN